MRGLYDGSMAIIGEFRSTLKSDLVVSKEISFQGLQADLNPPLKLCQDQGRQIPGELDPVRSAKDVWTIHTVIHTNTIHTTPTILGS